MPAESAPTKAVLDSKSNTTVSPVPGEKFRNLCEILPQAVGVATKPGSAKQTVSFGRKVAVLHICDPPITKILRLDSDLSIVTAPRSSTGHVSKFRPKLALSSHSIVSTRFFSVFSVSGATALGKVVPPERNGFFLGFL
jgi:hypothetical protein